MEAGKQLLEDQQGRKVQDPMEVGEALEVACGIRGAGVHFMQVVDL